jgi:hypothetical protein
VWKDLSSCYYFSFDFAASLAKRSALQSFVIFPEGFLLWFAETPSPGLVALGPSLFYRSNGAATVCREEKSPIKLAD